MLTGLGRKTQAGFSFATSLSAVRFPLYFFFLKVKGGFRDEEGRRVPFQGILPSFLPRPSKAPPRTRVRMSYPQLSKFKGRFLLVELPYLRSTGVPETTIFFVLALEARGGGGWYLSHQGNNFVVALVCYLSHQGNNFVVALVCWDCFAYQRPSGAARKNKFSYRYLRLWAALLLVCCEKAAQTFHSPLFFSYLYWVFLFFWFIEKKDKGEGGAATRCCATLALTLSILLIKFKRR